MGLYIYMVCPGWWHNYLHRIFFMDLLKKTRSFIYLDFTDMDSNNFTLDLDILKIYYIQYVFTPWQKKKKFSL